MPRRKCLNQTEQGKLVMTILMDHFNAFVRGSGLAHSLAFLEINVGEWVYETFEANILANYRLSPSAPEPMAPGERPVLAFKSAKLKLNPEARNPYEIKIKVLRDAQTST